MSAEKDTATDALTSSPLSSGVEVFVKDHIPLLVFGGLGAFVLFLALHIAVFVLVCRRTKSLTRGGRSKTKVSKGNDLKRSLLQDSDNASLMRELSQSRRSLSGRIKVRDESKAERNRVKGERRSERRHHSRSSKRHVRGRWRDSPVDIDREVPEEERFKDGRRESFNMGRSRSRSPKHKSSKPTARILPTSRTRLLSSSVHQDKMFPPSSNKNPANKTSSNLLPLGPPPPIPAPAPATTGQSSKAPLGFQKQSNIGQSTNAQLGYLQESPMGQPAQHDSNAIPPPPSPAAPPLQATSVQVPPVSSGPPAPPAPPPLASVQPQPFSAPPPPPPQVTPPSPIVAMGAPPPPHTSIVPPQPPLAPLAPINTPPPPPIGPPCPRPPPPPPIDASPAPRAVLKATQGSKAPARKMSHGDALAAAIAARRAKMSSSTTLNNNNSEPSRDVFVGSLAHIFPGIFSPQK